MVNIPKTPEEKRAYQARLWQRAEGAALDPVACLSALADEDWEDERENDQQARRVWLGTVFGLTPSGKVYAPFACSNVMGCATCGGFGQIATTKLRIQKKWNAKVARSQKRRYMKAGPVYVHRERRDAAHARHMRVYHNMSRTTRSCTACGGMGSREAYLDELWREHHEKLFEDYGLYFECGENADYFATEFRDMPEEEEEADDNEEASTHESSTPRV